jgi:hypothetical protein
MRSRPARPVLNVHEPWDWATPMRRVASAFNGREGVFLQLGDSLTLAAPNSHWARCGDWSSDEREFLDWAHAGCNDERDGWYLAMTQTGPPEELRSFTASVGCSAKYSLAGGRLPPLADLLATYTPQLAVYAVGTCDIVRKTPLTEYVSGVERALDLILERATVPILSTLTPCRTGNEAVLAANRELRRLAEERTLPLLDIYGELASRNANVFEFLDDDGVHLTVGRSKGPPTEAHFLESGYLLRCYLTVRKAMAVKARVFDCIQRTDVCADGRIL